MKRCFRISLAAAIMAMLACVLLPACGDDGVRPSGKKDLLHEVGTNFNSDLPIVIIDTYGAKIPDEPKIDARMTVIDNAPPSRNHVLDAPALDVRIGIEIRGTSSQKFPKKQYGIETRDEMGDDINVPFLGFPEESDWVLHAPYSDKTLMRNHLAMSLSRAMGRYASRTRFVEVLLRRSDTTFTYNGVYVGMEKIKRDGDRVDIEKIGNDLTGGYILKVDWPDPDEWYFTAPHGVDMIVDYPKAEDITTGQKAWIEAYIAQLHASLPAVTRVGDYTEYIDPASFIDFLLLRELFKDIDTYRSSTYFHKNKSGPLFAGPVWDFNLSSGNCNYLNLGEPEGWMLDVRVTAAFWWRSLLMDGRFHADVIARWEELRAGALSPAAIDAAMNEAIAVLDESQERNFERWRILGTYVWPNPPPFYETWEEEVERLRHWLHARGAWIDAHIGEPGS